MNRFFKVASLTLLAFMLVVVSLSEASAQTNKSRGVVAGGGMKQKIGNTLITGTVGQGAAGVVVNGTNKLYSGFWLPMTSSVTSVNEVSQASGIALMPNPFSSTTSISYNVEVPAVATVRIVDMNGSIVSTLVESQQQVGIVTLPWDGKNNAGVQVSTGKYITEIALTYANGRTEVKRESVVVAR